jgi:hypothetical protein
MQKKKIISDIKYSIWRNLPMSSRLKFLNIFIIGSILFTAGCGGGGGGDNSTVKDVTEITGFSLPSTSNSYFKYSEGGQKYTIPDIATDQAVVVATFRNFATTSGEGNLKITDVTAGTAKKSDRQKEKMEEIEYADSRYRPSLRNNYVAPRKFSKKKNQKNYSSTGKKRALDPIGTRDTFYHDEGTAGNKAFEKIYSGNKCLIYSEVNTTSDLPYVTATRGKEIGDTFEISNSYHPTSRPIFDVVTEYFGNPWGISASGEKINDGGRDGEEQVIFLFYKGGNSYGYFFWVDEEEKGFVNPDGGYISNGAEIVYINQVNSNDDIATYGTMAHEFQHLCDYNQKFVYDGGFSDQIFDESFDGAIPTLFNEGQSVLSEELNGFALKMPNNKGNDFIFNNVNTYLGNLSRNTPSFYSWSGGSDYGKGYLFWRFIYDSYGEDVLVKATHSKKLQPENIEEATNKKMDVLLQEYITAILSTDKPFDENAVYKITTIDRSQVYFDTTGVSLGLFSPLNYITGFKNNEIVKEDPYYIRLYKILPDSNNKVSFTITNIKPESNYSIFTSLVNK